MPKINNSDYSRWAARKSTNALKLFLERFAPLRAKQRLLTGEDTLLKGPKYLDRKILAATKELKSRENDEDNGELA